MCGEVGISTPSSESESESESCQRATEIVVDLHDHSRSPIGMFLNEQRKKQKKELPCELSMKSEVYTNDSLLRFMNDGYP